MARPATQGEALGMLYAEFAEVLVNSAVARCAKLVEAAAEEPATMQMTPAEALRHMAGQLREHRFVLDAKG